MLAFLFLPGTFLHELSHFLMAKALRVRTVGFTLIPKIGSDSIVLGSVGIEKPDPIRRFLIGIAPFLIGTTLLLFGIHFFNSLNLPLNSPYTLIFIYALFTISNTMFSSKKDLEGALELLLIALLIVGLLFLLGFRIDATTLPLPLTLLEQSIRLLLIPLGIDLVVLIITMVLLLITKKSTRILNNYE